MDLKAILQGLGAAATNPLAFVAYIGAIAAWALLRWRVERNKNLLLALNNLPERDRYKTLRDEMGVVAVKEGLSPEQFLRSKIHLYYFLGFVVVCFVIVILFAISAYKAANGARATNAGTLIAAATADPSIEKMKALDDIDLGVSRAFVIDKLGQPPHSTSKCADYKFPFARLQFLFDKKNRVTSKYVVKTREDYKPELLGKFSLAFEKTGCLGCFTFRDASQEGGGFEESSPPPIIWFNVPAGGPVIYAERYVPGARSWHRTVILVASSEGLEEKEAEGAAFAEIFRLYEMRPALVKFDDFYKRLTHDQKVRLNEARGKFRPNAFIEVENTGAESEDDGDDIIVEDTSCGS